MQAKTPSKLGSRGEMVRLEKVGCTIALGTVTTVTVSLTREEMKVRPARQYGFQKDGGDMCCKSSIIKCECKH